MNRVVALACAVTAGTAWSVIPLGPATASPALAVHALDQQLVPRVDSAVDAGATDPAIRITVGVVLAQDTGAETAAALAVNDPTSSSYRHFFTPAAWNARFAVPRSTYDGTVRALTSQGLRVVSHTASRGIVQLAGTAAAVEQTFHVSLREYRTKSGGVYRANANAPTVPGTVVAVKGLSDLHPVTHGQSDCAQNVCVGTLTFRDLWSVYDAPTAVTGAGQKIAIFGETDTSGPTADLHQFESENGLPIVPTVCHPIDLEVCVDPANASGEGEWALDSEASTAMAPDVAEVDYYFPDTLVTDYDAFAAWANDPNGPKQANASYGECEGFAVAFGDVDADNPSFIQAAAEGRTLFSSTGDTGGSCYIGLPGNGIANTGVPQQEWPAASRWVTAVGGTVLYTDGQGHRATLPSGDAGEYAWSHTGGGTSYTQPEQAWQASIGAPIVGQCALDDENPVAGPTTCRGAPDVAAMSGDITVVGGGDSMADVEGGSDTSDGGTSLSSPLWCGIWARLQSAAPNGVVGFAPPALYAVAKDPAKDANDLYDVSRGSNVQNPAIPRSAADPTGWDYVSGLGVPDVTHLMADLLNPGVTPTTPEAPYPTLLILIAGGLAASVVLWRRRSSNALS